jgi:nicotinamide mononucleotide adenylyltransferase
MSKIRNFEPHPDARSGRVGLIVAELQTVHWGHVRLMMEMAASCDTGILAIGSTQRHGVEGHPFSFDQRKDMVQAIFGPQFKILPLQDIDASLETGDWLKYVLSRIASASLPAPTDYFTGSAIDARFYTDYFASLEDPSVSNGPVRTYSSLSGREIRHLIEARDPEWRNYVPAKLWNYVERHYPPHLRTAIKTGGEMPEDVPVGTRCLARDDPTVLVLRDDGKWRPLRDGGDEKAGHRRAGAR